MFAVFHIRAKTIYLSKPLIAANGGVKRIAVNGDAGSEKLIGYESYLRRVAYKNTTITTNNDFFNDCDMAGNYFLVVVCYKNTPLLSARYYDDEATIIKSLKGENNNEELVSKIGLGLLKSGTCFLADRFSANVNSGIYRQYRRYILLLLYLQFFNYNRNRQLILMARKERGDKLQKKYQALGLGTIGVTQHKGKQHWVLMGDVEACYKQLKMPFALQVILKLKLFFIK